MQSEYDLVSRLFGFSEADFQQIYANTLRARFQPKLDGDVIQTAL
jgi:hypothetical protein